MPVWMQENKKKFETYVLERGINLFVVWTGLKDVNYIRKFKSFNPGKAGYLCL